MGELKIYADKMSTVSLPDIIKEMIDEGILFNYLIFEPMIVERYNETFFKRFHIDKMAIYNLPESYSGRVFGEDTEIRWRRDGNEFVVLIISEKEKISPGSTFNSLEDIEDISKYEAKHNAYFLWGEHLQDNKWYEGRIPRILEYPVDGTPEHVKLNVVEYQKDGLTQFIRFVKLEGEK
jgi:hypothetical protein